MSTQKNKIVSVSAQNGTAFIYVESELAGSIRYDFWVSRHGAVESINFGSAFALKSDGALAYTTKRRDGYAMAKRAAVKLLAARAEAS